MNHRITHQFAAFVLITLSYEWLVSGLDKIINGAFVSGLRAQVQQSIPHMQYRFYGNILRIVGLNHIVLLGNLVQYGELVVGLTFAILAVQLWRNRLHPMLITFGAIVSFISSFMNLNFLFYQGGSFFVNPSDPFDEGIPIDLVILFIQLGMLYVMVAMLKGRRKRNLISVLNTETKGEFTW